MFHNYVSPDENNELFKFRFPDAPPFAQITYKFGLEAPSDFLSLYVDAHPNNLPSFKNHTDMQYTGGTLGVNKDRDMYMKTFLKPGTSPFSVRVYVEAWEELDTPAPDVRENRIRTREMGLAGTKLCIGQFRKRQRRMVFVSASRAM